MVAAVVLILFVYPFIQKYFVKGALLGSPKGYGASTTLVDALAGETIL